MREADRPPLAWGARARRRLRSRRVVVVDRSMEPTLEPGDRLRVDVHAYRDRTPAVGDIVVVVDPEDRSRWLVKRVWSIAGPPAAVEVRGDAAEVARDSRQFGPLPAGAVVGRVYALYAPTSRRRPL